jgi:hypothetical protein
LLFDARSLKPPAMVIAFSSVRPGNVGISAGLADLSVDEERTVLLDVDHDLRIDEVASFQARGDALLQLADGQAEDADLAEHRVLDRRRIVETHSFPFQIFLADDVDRDDVPGPQAIGREGVAAGRRHDRGDRQGRGDREGKERGKKANHSRRLCARADIRSISQVPEMPGVCCRVRAAGPARAAEFGFPCG